MTRRFLAALGFIAALFPVGAAAASNQVPIARAGHPIGEAPPASLLSPSAFRAVFRVEHTGTTLYLGTQWYVRDLRVTLVGPGTQRRTLEATPSLPGSMLGLRLPDDAWRADRIEMVATTVSSAPPPYLLSAENLAKIGWRNWMYAAFFGLFLGLALVHGILAVTLRSAAFGWYTAVMGANAALMLPWLGIVRPSPNVSQPLHAALEIVTIAGLALFSTAYMHRARVARVVLAAVWLTVALNACSVIASDVLQDFSPLNDFATQVILGAMALAFVALGVVGRRRNVDGATYYLAATLVAAAGLIAGTFAQHVYNPLIQLAPQLGTALEALLLALALSVQLRRQEREHVILHRLAHIDGLTGIANRASLDDLLHREWRRARAQRAPIAALMIDVDHFKNYNDAYGHPAGDDVLRRIARALATTASRAHDVVARYGGEEFVVLLPETGLEAAQHLGDAIVAEIAALGIPHGSAPAQRVTVSIGAAAMVPEGDDDGALIARADTALYIAKAMGRNCVVADELALVPS